MSNDKFYFIMQHKPTTEQLYEARNHAASIVALAPRKPEDRVEGVTYSGSVTLLDVPDDPNLSRSWFTQRATEIFEALEMPSESDTVQIMGQQQLSMAMNAIAQRQGSNRVESVTKRDSQEVTQPDGSVKKETVFRFMGFRTIYEF